MAWSFTLHGSPTARTERGEMRLAHLFKPNIMSRFGELDFLLVCPWFFPCWLKVQTKGGVQYVTTKITQIGSPISEPDVTTQPANPEEWDPMVVFWVHLIAISNATQGLLLGQAVLHSEAPLTTSWINSSLGFQPSFLQNSLGTDVTQFVWGDVLKGIEEMSYNVTVGLLTLQLGTMNANCSFDQQVVIYQYNSLALWAPYGVSHFSVLSCYYFTFPSSCFIDGLGHCSTFTCCCHPDNGEK